MTRAIKNSHTQVKEYGERTIPTYITGTSTHKHWSVYQSYSQGRDRSTDHEDNFCEYDRSIDTWKKIIKKV